MVVQGLGYRRCLSCSAIFDLLVRGVDDALVRGVDDALVRALKKRAGAHGRSAEAEHRAILASALLAPPRRNLAELLAALPNVGSDEDFQRPAEREPVADVFG